MTINARPHMNGNSADDFKSAHYSLNHAEDQLGRCVQDMHRFVVHGRNYQHLDAPDAARAADLEQLDRLIQGVIALRDLKRDIAEALS